MVYWNGAEAAPGLRRFLSNANCGEKNNESGPQREGQSGFRKQEFFFFFFGLKVQMTDLYSCCFNSALKVLFQGS